MRFSAGLDLGQVNDFSALVVAEVEGSGWQRTYTVRLARRWRGLQYTVLAGEVGQILKREPLTEGVVLKVDATGVGRAVLDILEQAHGDGVLPCWPEAVTFTSGEQAGPYSLPKRDAVARVEVLIAQGRLRFAWHLLLARQIKDELREFRAKVSGSGHVSFEASGSGHDDLVTALSLAVHEGSNEQLEAIAAAYGVLQEPEGELCPVCGARCGGVLPGDGTARCTSVVHAGRLELNYESDPPTHVHILVERCPCGWRHDPIPMEVP